MAGYDQLPTKATLQPAPFKVHFPDEQIQDFKKLVQLSPIGPKTFENQQTERQWGVTREWLIDAKEYWQDKFHWRKSEDHINSFPNYKVDIEDDEGDAYAIHFTALFSQKADATPLVLLHGWPGSFLEFLPILDLVRSKYKPDALPFHIIVPSLPGYGLSAGPSLKKEWRNQDIASMMNKLMTGLGLDGYVAQGGDIGSMVARILATKYDACKAYHLNFSPGPPPNDKAFETITELEKRGLARGKDFSSHGHAYADEHGTRPSTIGLALSSSPLALLAWVGEKFIVWTDTTPPLATILESVTLYWLTETIARGMYPYTQIHDEDSTVHSDADYHSAKPLGYSYFPMEIVPSPVSWVAQTGKLVWSRVHEEGGHFAALEKPELLWGDIEDFVAQLG